MKNSITKIMALMLALVIFAGVFVSVDYVGGHVHHECTGDRCEICIHIREAINYISNLKSLIVLPFVAAVVCLMTQAFKKAETISLVKHTLISLKVELLN